MDGAGRRRTRSPGRGTTSSRPTSRSRPTRTPSSWPTLVMTPAEVDALGLKDVAGRLPGPDPRSPDGGKVYSLLAPAAAPRRDRVASPSAVGRRSARLAANGRVSRSGTMPPWHCRTRPLTPGASAPYRSRGPTRPSPRSPAGDRPPVPVGPGRTVDRRRTSQRSPPRRRERLSDPVREGPASAVARGDPGAPSAARLARREDPPPHHPGARRRRLRQDHAPRRLRGRTRLRTLWYRLDEDDRDWISLLNHLVAAGREADPAFAPNTAAMLADTSLERPDPRRRHRGLHPRAAGHRAARRGPDLRRLPPRRRRARRPVDRARDRGHGRRSDSRSSSPVVGRRASRSPSCGRPARSPS